MTSRPSPNMDWAQPHFARSFESTRWPLINRAGTGDQEAQGLLYRLYAYPIYGFLRRKQVSPEDAEDLIQELFFRFSSNSPLSVLDSSEGRFRTWLMRCADNLRKDHLKARHAEKRGGGQRPVPFDQLEAERQCQADLWDTYTPERQFDRHWARLLMGHALERWEREYGGAINKHRFEVLKKLLLQGEESRTYAELGAELGISEQAIKGEVSRSRQRLRRILTEEIGRTVLDPSEIEPELHHLFESLQE